MPKIARLRVGGINGMKQPLQLGSGYGAAVQRDACGHEDFVGNHVVRTVERMAPIASGRIPLLVEAGKIGFVRLETGGGNAAGLPCGGQRYAVRTVVPQPKGDKSAAAFGENQSAVMDKAAFRRRLQPRVAKLRAAVACFVGEAINRRTVGQLGQYFTFQVGTGAQVGMAVRVGTTAKPSGCASTLKRGINSKTRQKRRMTSPSDVMSQ